MHAPYNNGELERMNASPRRLSDFEKLQPLDEQSIIPGHNHNDRLMRAKGHIRDSYRQQLLSK